MDEIVNKITWLKIGTGKKALPVLGVESYQTAGGQAYAILHHDTLTLVGDGYYFKELARGVAQEVMLTLGDKLKCNDIPTLVGCFSQELRDYIDFYRYLDSKKPLSFEDFVCGLDYERLLSDRRNRQLLIEQEAQYKKELWEGNLSVGWMADPKGRIDLDTMGAINDGRPLACQFVLS